MLEEQQEAKEDIEFYERNGRMREQPKPEKQSQLHEPTVGSRGKQGALSRQLKGSKSMGDLSEDVSPVSNISRSNKRVTQENLDD